MKIAIVTDSTADIPAEVAEDEGIYVMPNNIIIEGKSYEDGKGISRKEFYELMPSLRELPTTATASAGEYVELYEQLFRQGFDAILSIHVSELLSGVINAAATAAQSFAGRVSVFDSSQVSMGLGWQAIAAAEAARSQLSMEQVISRVKGVRRRVHLIAMLDTLEYIRRSGRVSWARASLGMLLQLKPFLDVKDGTVLRLGEARTRRKGILRLIEMFHKLGPVDRLAIVHTNAENEACQLLEAIGQQGTYKPLIVNVTTIIGTHVGPGCLGFAVVTADQEN